MITKIKLITWFAISCVLMACKQDDLRVYAGKKFTVIGKTWTDDVSGYSFSYTNQEDLTTTGVSLNLEVKLMGAKLADSSLVVPYSVAFESDDLGPAGLPGQRYQLEGTLSGKQLTDTIALEFLRDSAFMDSVYTVKVSLGTAAEYKTDVEGAERLGFFRVLDISIHDRFEEPYWWKNYVGYLGAFSSKKIRTLFEVFGWQSFPLFQTDYWLSSRLSQEPMATGMEFKVYLEEKARTGTPIYERDGSLMTVGTLVYESQL